MGRYLDIIWGLSEPASEFFKTALTRKGEPNQIAEVFFNKSDLRRYLMSLNIAAIDADRLIKKAKANGSVRVEQLGDEWHIKADDTIRRE